MAAKVEDLVELSGQMVEHGKRYEVEELQRLAEAYRQILQRLEYAPPLADEAYKPAMKALLKARSFTELARTAECLRRTGCDTPYVRTLQGQALIELGQVKAAITLLENVTEDATAPEEDRLEALGLLGRAHKQLYIDEKRQPRAKWAEQDLRNSLASYSKGFDANRPVETNWHAINTAALIVRARKDGIVLPDEAQAAPIAQLIIDALGPVANDPDGKTDTHAWASGMIGNAYVLLEKYEEAARWFARYIEQNSTDAHKLVGTARQLREVLCIKPGNDPAGRLLCAFESRILGLRRGLTVFSQDDVRALLALDEGKDGSPEAILGSGQPFTARWLKKGLGAACSVARVQRSSSGRRRPEDVGTGFLVKGEDLCASLGSEVFLLTNCHVIGDPPDQHGIRPGQAVVSFDEGGAGANEIRCKEVVWQSSFRELDAALVRFETQVEQVAPLALAPDDALPEAFGEAERGQVYIIGHPEADEVSISLQDTDLIDVGYKEQEKPMFTYLHYRTPTKPGSSGSPVFSRDDWQVVGLHHAGPPQSGGSRKLHGKKGFNPPANEGIAIRSIRRAIAEYCGGKAKGA